MARLDEYTFLTTNLITGEPLAYVELSSFNWSLIYNAPGTALATARFQSETTTPENFPEWSSALWAIKDGIIQFGGITGKTQRRGGSRVLSIPVHGFFKYLNHRILRSDAGMNYGVLTNTSDVIWTNVDPFHIVEDLVNHVQQFTNGNIGLGVTWDVLSGAVIPSKTHQIFAVRYVGDIITDLASRIDTGFNFGYEFSFINDRPHCDIKLDFPTKGTISNHVLEFSPQKTVNVSVPLINALSTPGTDNNYADTPDSTSITGDMEILVYTEPIDWTPALEETFISKGHETNNNLAWRLVVLPSGLLRFYWSEDGTVVRYEDSSVAPSFADGTEGTIKVIMDVDVNSEDYKVTFFESSDVGLTWITLSDDPYEPTYTVRY